MFIIISLHIIFQQFISNEIVAYSTICNLNAVGATIGAVTVIKDIMNSHNICTSSNACSNSSRSTHHPLRRFIDSGDGSDELLATRTQQPRQPSKCLV